MTLVFCNKCNKHPVNPYLETICNDCYTQKIKEIADSLNRIHYHHYLTKEGLRLKTPFELAGTFEPKNGCKQCEEDYKYTADL